MGHDHAARLALAGAAAHRIGVRDTQDLARLQAVHIVADEGVGIGAVQRNQHHVERDVGRLDVERDRAERIAAAHAVAVLRFACLGLARLAFGAAAGGGDACLFRWRGGRSSWRRGRSWRGRRPRRGWPILRRRRHLGRLGRTQLGRVEQEGVFAHQATAIPGQLQQHVDEGLVKRLGRADPDHLAPGPLVDRKAQRQQGRVEFDVRGAEGFGRSQLDRHACRVFAGAGRQLDLGAQRLAKRRQHRQFPQPGCVGGGSQEHCTGDGGGDRFQRGCHERRLVRRMHS